MPSARASPPPPPPPRRSTAATTPARTTAMAMAMATATATSATVPRRHAFRVRIRSDDRAARARGADPRVRGRPVRHTDRVAMAGQVVWITGASAGIGAAVAEELARRGAVVVATARRTDALAGLAARAPGVHAKAGDITDA